MPRRLTHYILVDRRVVECADLMQWAKWMELSRNDDSFRVAQDTVAGFWVSTVFLGLDHRFMDDGPPILFESMVFAEKGEKSDWLSEESMQRYCTFEEAERGHRAIVDSLRALESSSIEITRAMLAIVRGGLTATMRQYRENGGE